PAGVGVAGGAPRLAALANQVDELQLDPDACLPCLVALIRRLRVAVVVVGRAADGRALGRLALEEVPVLLGLVVGRAEDGLRYVEREAGAERGVSIPRGVHDRPNAF